MLEEKQGQFWNQHLISHKVRNRYFQFSPYFLMRQEKRKKKMFPKILKTNEN